MHFIVDKGILLCEQVQIVIETTIRKAKKVSILCLFMRTCMFSCRLEVMTMTHLRNVHIIIKSFINCFNTKQLFAEMARWLKSISESGILIREK